MKMFGSISHPKHFALNWKDFQLRDIVILSKAGKTESFVMDCKDVQFLLQKCGPCGEVIRGC